MHWILLSGLIALTANSPAKAGLCACGALTGEVTCVRNGDPIELGVIA